MTDNRNRAPVTSSDFLEPGVRAPRHGPEGHRPIARPADIAHPVHTPPQPGRSAQEDLRGAARDDRAKSGQIGSNRRSGR